MKKFNVTLPLALEVSYSVDVIIDAESEDEDIEREEIDWTETPEQDLPSAEEIQEL